MRWTLTSPDGIGDFLLRVPWMQEMGRRGWRLQLVAREPTLEAARLVGLDADCVPIGLSPYSKTAKLHKDPFRGEMASITKHRPDLVFFGPSQPTFLEEEIALRLEGVPFAGFVLEEDFWPSEGLSDPRLIAGRLARAVPVRDTDSEPMRNLRAAETLLGRPVSLAPLRLDPDRCGPPPDGLPRRFLCVSPGYREGDYFQGWGTESWTQELRALEALTELPMVFTGSAGERRSNALIVESLAHPARHVDLTGSLSSLAQLGAVLAKAEAYVGKDSGAMHLAGALGRPVLAVFGGGHRRRFYPASGPAVVLTVDVPCRGCDWRCHLPEPACVRGLKTGSLVAGWRTLGGLQDREVVPVEQQPSAELEAFLAAHPQNSHPERAHAGRKQEWRKLREQALSPLPVRILRKLAASRGTG